MLMGVASFYTRQTIKMFMVNDRNRNKKAEKSKILIFFNFFENFLKKVLDFFFRIGYSITRRCESTTDNKCA